MKFSEAVLEKAPDPSLKEKLAAIPIAKTGADPADLRRICLQYMKLQLSFQWLPKEDYNYVVSTQNHPVSLKKGTLHGGLPYVNIGTGNLYRFAEFYNEETGEVDLAELAENKELVGNSCSGAVSAAWARCITSAKLGYTFDMTQYNGYVPVGPYQYSPHLKQFIVGKYETEGMPKYTPDEICKENGKETMYESYAQVMPADGLVNHGHVRMVSSSATVFRNKDGKINGQASFLLFCDQVCYENEKHHLTQSDNTDDAVLYKRHGGVDVRVSFADLYETGYIPFTFKEFLGEAPVKKPKCNANVYKTAFSTEELKDIVLTANYPITELYITVKDPEGNVLYKHTKRRVNNGPEHSSLYQFSVGEVVPLQEIKPFEDACCNTLSMEGLYLKGSVKPVFDGILMSGTTASKVFDPLTPEKLAAIPLATPDMTPDELRKLVIDYMNLQLSFQYTPSEDYHYPATGSHNCVLKKGEVRGGLPYITIGSGNLYRIMEFYDPKTGVLDMTEFKKMHQRFYGNACSGGAGTSWGRCITSAKLTWCAGMHKGNGFIPVGPYDYEFKGAWFNKNTASPNYFCPRVICAQNGEKTMFESYANAKLADGLVSGAGGHIRLVSMEPVVVRNGDGTIDGEKSFMHYSDQGCYTGSWKRNHAQKTPDGNHYIVQGGVNVKISFKDLFDHGYIPVTFAEFLGTKKVEIPAVTTNITLKEISAALFSAVKFKSNYAISDVFVSVTDSDGKTLYRDIKRFEHPFAKTFVAGEFLDVEALKPYEKDGTYRLKVEFQLFHGSKICAYDATLKA